MRRGNELSVLDNAREASAFFWRAPTGPRPNVSPHRPTRSHVWRHQNNPPGRETVLAKAHPRVTECTSLPHPTRSEPPFPERRLPRHRDTTRPLGERL